MKNEIVARGKVVSLCINGNPKTPITFDMKGPVGDSHSQFERKLSGHDGVYIKTSHLKKGSRIFNWRSWTALSQEEITEVESEIGFNIPQGCLFENIVLSGIPSFSKLKPTSRLVFFRSSTGASDFRRPVLAVWEENSPCHIVGERLEYYHNKPGLKTDFVKAAQNKRGLMGFVLARGVIEVGDSVLVYPPVE